MDDHGQAEMFALDPAAELAYAKSLRDGMQLSPAAQVLYEAEGAARFQQYHGRRLSNTQIQQTGKDGHGS